MLAIITRYDQGMITNVVVWTRLYRSFLAFSSRLLAKMYTFRPQKYHSKIAVRSQSGMRDIRCVLRLYCLYYALADAMTLVSRVLRLYHVLTTLIQRPARSHHVLNASQDKWSNICVCFDQDYHITMCDVSTTLLAMLPRSGPIWSRSRIAVRTPVWCDGSIKYFIL